jgi:hypothetical protein
LPWLLVGGIVLAVVVLLAVVGGAAAWLLFRSSPRPSSVVAMAPDLPPAPPAAAPAGNAVWPGQPDPQPAAPPGLPQPPGANNNVHVTLSNPHMNRTGMRIEFTVDYSFDQGAPPIAGVYVWRIESRQGSYKVNLFAHEFQKNGTFRAQGIEIRGDPGPFDMYLEANSIGPVAGDRISNSVQVTAPPDAAMPGRGLPGRPPSFPPRRGPRP